MDGGDRVGTTPLMLACRNNRLAAAKAVIDHGADLNALRKQGRRGSRQLSPDDYDGSPLTIAAGGGHRAIVKHLLESGAKVNQRT